MKPLNGRCRMTKDERNARRRELNKNPFHRELTNRVSRKWREANKDKLNARRRESYAANREKQIERSRRWRAENPDKAKASWKKWADKNRDYLHERDRIKRLDPEKERRRKELRKIRDSSPEGRARNKEAAKRWYQKNKNSASGLRWTMKFLWIPRWEKLEYEGQEAVEKYLKRCNERTRSYYRAWKSGSPIIDRILKGRKA